VNKNQRTTLEHNRTLIKLDNVIYFSKLNYRLLNIKYKITWRSFFNLHEHRATHRGQSGAPEAGETE